MQLNLDVAYFRESNSTALHLECLRREYETIEAIAPFESWKSRNFSLRDSPKEILERTIETNQDGLQCLCINTLELRTHFFDGWQLRLLL